MLDDKPHCTRGDSLKRKLISRRAPKEGFAIKKPLVRVTYPERLTYLSTKQQDVISLLNNTIKELKCYDKLEESEIERMIKDKGSKFNRLREQLIDDISKAVGIGLITHPLVAKFITNFSVFGNKEILRKIKKGLERGVKRPIKEKDIKFELQLDKIVEDRNTGKTWKRIRRDLMKRRIIGRMSPQGLEKKVKKSWQARWEELGKKAPPIR